VFKQLGLFMNQKFKLPIALTLILITFLMSLLDLDASSITGVAVFRKYHSFFQVASFILVVSLFFFPTSQIIKYLSIFCVGAPLLKIIVTIIQIYLDNTYITKLVTGTLELALWVELILRISTVIILISYKPKESSDLKS
jgi:hypothetical protein